MNFRKKTMISQRRKSPDFYISWELSFSEAKTKGENLQTDFSWQLAQATV